MINETTAPEILPEILEAEWDHGQVMALFDDLSRGAEVSHVQVRSNNSNRSQDQRATLDEASEMFRNRAAKAIQIQYRFDGQAWCDTLMVGAHTTKIIRTRSTNEGTS